MDTHGNEGGFALLTPATTAGVPGGQPPGELALARPHPNPARQSVVLSFALPRAAVVSLAIYDAGGRRVRGLASGEQPAGDHAVVWDLRDEAGRVVPGGLFFVRLQAEGRELRGRLVAMP